MVIEVRKNYLSIDGVKQEKNKVFRITEYGGPNSKRKAYLLDFRQSILRQEEYIEIRNKSGHGISIIGINDWNASIKTSQAVEVRQGYMEYMSQYSI